MSEDKKIKVQFMPGSFDNFEGTQEELNELVAEIMRLAESGELPENAQEIELDDIDDAELIEQLERYREDSSKIAVNPRKLN